MKHSLRLRLTLACLALLAVGLIGVGTVTYRLVDSFLVQRVDQQLADRALRASLAVRRVASSHGDGPPPPGDLELFATPASASCRNSLDLRRRSPPEGT